MKNRKLIILGISEIAKVAYEYFKYDSEYDVEAFCVNKEYLRDDSFMGLPVIPFENIEKIYSPNRYSMFIAVGASKLNTDREFLYKSAKEKGYKLASYISPKAFIWNNVEVGDNCFILENNVLQPFVKIGNNVTLWSGNHIGHGTEIKDNCFITSHCVISGLCTIGKNTYMGVNSSVAENINIADKNFIGMACAIHKKTKPDALYISEYGKKQAISASDYFGVN